MTQDTPISPAVLYYIKAHGISEETVAATRSKPISELREMARQYLYSGRQYYAPQKEWLALVPAFDLVESVLIEVLQLDDCFEHDLKSASIHDTPGVRAAKILSNLNSYQGRQILLSWLPRADEKILRGIAKPLVEFGTDDLLPDVTVLFEYQEAGVMQYIASDARSGALAAAHRQRIEPKFREFLWDHCLNLLRLPKPPEQHPPSFILEALEPEKFAKALHHPDFLRLDHPILTRILATLNRLKAPASPEFLLEYLATIPAQGCDKTAGRREVAWAGLELQNHPAAKESFDSILMKPNLFDEYSVISAWEARFRSRGFVLTLEIAEEKYRESKQGFAALDPIEQDFLLMDRLQFAINQQGIHFFYGDDELGKYALRTIKVLSRVGNREHAELFFRIVALYADGPVGNHDEVLDYLFTLDDAMQVKIAKLLEKFFDIPNWYLNALKWDWERQSVI